MWTLYLTCELHRYGTMEAKIMKYHILSGYVDKSLAEGHSIFKIKLSFLTDILLQFKKLIHSVNSPFLSSIIHILFASYPPVSKRQGKQIFALHPSTRDLAGGFWGGS